MALKTKPEFISPDDFLNYWNKDLRELLRDNGFQNDSNKANLFLVWVEDEFFSWCDANLGSRVCNWEQVKTTPRLYEAVQKALLYQAQYVFRNSFIALDSGYDPEKGIVAPKANLEKLEICTTSINFMKQAGLYSHAMRNRRRFSNVGGFFN